MTALRKLTESPEELIRDAVESFLVAAPSRDRKDIALLAKHISRLSLELNERLGREAVDPRDKIARRCDPQISSEADL